MPYLYEHSTTYNAQAWPGSDGELLRLILRSSIRTQCGSFNGADEGCRCLTGAVRIRIEGVWRLANLQLGRDTLLGYFSVLKLYFTDGLPAPLSDELDAHDVRRLQAAGSLELAYRTRCHTNSMASTPGRTRPCELSATEFNY